MGVLDKIKNALFEVEYVEVEEPPKKDKKDKNKIKKDLNDNKPIAKKVILPGKKEEKIEELKEEELLDEDFEIRPKEEKEIEKVHEEFKFMDDNDFKVDEEEYLNVSYEEPEIVEEKPIYNGYEDRQHNKKAYDNPNYSTTNLYGMNNNYSVPVHQYGTYEKEEKTYFKPSPIISPIYGILDKNYKKEDVKEKKEVRLSGYTRGNIDVDDIRAKAYGNQQEVVEDLEEVKFDVEEVSDNTMVDLSDRSKPEVKELTVGDAEEYFEDLGLEYNVDYVDVSADKKSKQEEKIEKEIEELPPVLDNTPVDELIKEESNNDEDDNLFDLIDSMYQENE